MSQNYLNPFKDKTSIKYCLSEKAKVYLTLFNSKNEKIKELLCKVQKAGTYETILDSQNLLPEFTTISLKLLITNQVPESFLLKRRK